VLIHNLLHLGVSLLDVAGESRVVRADVRDYVRRPASEPFEVVFIAPPQYKGLWKETLLLLDKNPSHVAPDGIVVVQIDPQEKSDVDLSALTPGEHLLVIRAADSAGNTGLAKVVLK
jgi:16S rRNA G966 N2-methylase RsmD